MVKSWPDGTAAETWRNWRLLRSKRKEPATMIHRTWKSPRKVRRQRVSKDSEVVPTLLYIHIIFIHVPKRNEELNRKYNSFLWCYSMMSIQYIYNIIILILHIYCNTQTLNIWFKHYWRRNGSTWGIFSIPLSHGPMAIHFARPAAITSDGPSGTGWKRIKTWARWLQPLGWKWRIHPNGEFSY